MFVDKQSEHQGFASSWKKARSVTDGSMQTDPRITTEADSQCPDRKSVEVQAEAEVKPFYFAYVENINSLAEFLNRVTPYVCKQLAKNAHSHAFDRCSSHADLETGDTRLRYTLTSEPLSSKFQVTSLSWNSTGSIVAATYSAENHDDWCTHDSGICLWNVHRKDFNPHKASTEIETDGCLTCVAFHPEFPSILVAGKFTGEIVLWNVGREDDLMMAGTAGMPDSHHESITGLHWMKDPQGQTKLMFASCSLDGHIFIWKVNDRTSCLEVASGFVLLADHLPHSLGIKSSRPDAEVGGDV